MLLLTVLALAVALCVEAAPGRQRFGLHLSPEIDGATRSFLIEEVKQLNEDLTYVEIVIAERPDEAQVRELTSRQASEGGWELSGQVDPVFSRREKVSVSCEACRSINAYSVRRLLHGLLAKTLFHEELGLYPRIDVRECRLDDRDEFLIEPGVASEHELGESLPLEQDLFFQVGVWRNGRFRPPTEIEMVEHPSEHDGGYIFVVPRWSPSGLLVQRCTSPSPQARQRIQLVTRPSSRDWHEESRPPDGFVNPAGGGGR